MYSGARTLFTWAYILKLIYAVGEAVYHTHVTPVSVYHICFRTSSSCDFLSEEMKAKTESTVAVLLLIVPTCLGFMDSHNFKGPKNGQTGSKLTGNILSTHNKTSPVRCAQKCTVLTHCTAFNMRAGRVCELLETDPHNHAEKQEPKAKYFVVSSINLLGPIRKRRTMF